MLSSQDQVFFTPELFQLILLQLPLHDLLVTAQRINHHFHRTITTSSALQKALFFQPCPADSTLEPQANPLLAVTFNAWFQDRRHFTNRRFFPTKEAFYALDWASSPDKTIAYARPDASWRQMLVVQPPATTLDVVHASITRKGDWEMRASIAIQQGITMGVLYDIVEDWMTAQPHKHFVVNWHMLSPPEVEGESGVGMDVTARDRITLVLLQFLGCRQFMPVALDAKFKSQAFKHRPLQFTPAARPSIVTW